MQKFSYHTHSPFSDGDNSIEEMVQKALELGLEDLGISDHLIVHRNIKETLKWEKEKNYRMLHTDFDLVKELAKKHISEVRKISQKYPELNLYLGFEVDFFDEEDWISGFKNFLQGLDLDYLIYGNHRFSDDGKLFLSNKIDEVASNEEERTKLIKLYFMTMKSAVKSGFFDFTAHLDWGFSKIKGIEKYESDVDDIINDHVIYNMPTELSTRRLAREGRLFPEMEILKKLKDKNIPILLSDDAHRAYELCREFKEGEEVLKSLDYNNRWRMSNNPKFRNHI